MPRRKKKVQEPTVSKTWRPKTVSPLVGWGAGTTTPPSHNLSRMCTSTPLKQLLMSAASRDNSVSVSGSGGGGHRSALGNISGITSGVRKASNSAPSTPRLLPFVGNQVLSPSPLSMTYSEDFEDSLEYDIVSNPPEDRTESALAAVMRRASLTTTPIKVHPHPHQIMRHTAWVGRPMNPDKVATKTKCISKTAMKTNATHTDQPREVFVHEPAKNMNMSGLAVHMAARNNDIGLLARLFSGPDALVYKEISADFMGYSPLHWAASKGNVEALQFFLEHGARVNERTLEADTPLHLAATEGSVPCIDMLLKAGAVIRHENAIGKTALECAQQWGHRECVLLLSDWYWSNRLMYFQPKPIPPPVGPNPALCQVTGQGLEEPVTKEPNTLVLLSVGYDGKVRKKGGDEFWVRWRGPANPVYCKQHDKKDGTYVIEFELTTSGRYEFYISYSGRQLKGSPYQLEVQAGEMLNMSPHRFPVDYVGNIGSLILAGLDEEPEIW
eukprot:GFYU01004776.1.p1 GENE.GFYU01004776.1~~GFYU01004776.1.p1  ORF type:complete len:498 (-),score=89.61 GFYU01004776.1:117-1610(-)